MLVKPEAHVRWDRLGHPPKQAVESLDVELPSLDLNTELPEVVHLLHRMVPPEIDGRGVRFHVDRIIRGGAHLSLPERLYKP